MKKISMKKIMNSTKGTEMRSGHTPEWAMVLEPVRKLPTNVGSRIRKCIYQALEKDPPKWAKKRLELSISKEVYKGNASGPTKRAVIDVLTDLEQKIVQEKVKRKKNKKMKIDEEGGVEDLVMKRKIEEEGGVVDGVEDLVMKKKIEEVGGVVDGVDDLLMKEKIEEEGCIVESVDDLVMKKKKKKRKMKIDEERCVVDSVDDLVMMKKKIEEEVCVVDGIDDLAMKEKIEEDGGGVDGVDDLVMKEKIEEERCRVDSVDDLVMKKLIEEEGRIVESVDDLAMKKRKTKKKNKKKKKKMKIDEERCVVDSVEDLVTKKKIDEEGCVVESVERVDNLVMKKKIDEEVCVVDGVDDLVMKEKIDEEGCIVESVDDLVMKKKIEEEVCVVDGVDDLVMKEGIAEEGCIVESVDDLVTKKKIEEEVCVVDDLVMKEKIDEAGCCVDGVDDLAMKEKIEEEGCCVDSVDDLVIEEEGCWVDSVDDFMMKEKIEEEGCCVDSVDDLVMKKVIEEEGCCVDSVDDFVMKEKIEEQVCFVDSVDDSVMKKKKIEEQVCVVDNVDDSVMKQCSLVLSRVAAEDKDRIFFDFLKGNGNDEGCFIGNTVMGSGLDFKSIDLKLADGSYCGSHEAFYVDVQEVWRNVCVSFKEQVDLVKLAERLGKIFEEMYNNEVLAFVQKTAECASSVAIKELDDSLAGVTESLIPETPREEGICQVCGMDNNGDNVLLCSGCDSEYHRCCLNLPLVKIPEGNLYCPSCVSIEFTSGSKLSSSGVDSQCKLKKCQRLDQLANTMMIKDDRVLNGEEGTICLQCGDVGFDNAYVYCVKCLKFFVHRYCLPEIPKTFDEFVHWVCDHCGAVSSGSTWQKDLLNGQDE